MLPAEKRLLKSFKNKISKMQSLQLETHPSSKPQLNRSQAVQKIISYSDKNHNLIQKYSESFFTEYFDCEKLQELSKSIPTTLEMTKEEFVKRMACFIKHQISETLFLIMSLVEVYEKIRMSIRDDRKVKVTDFTGFICDSISDRGVEGLIPLKEIAAQRARPDPLRLRRIDLQPPTIVSQVEKKIPQISKTKKKKDKKVDSENQLSQFVVSPSLGSILTLGSLSSNINIFDLKFNKKSAIFPECFKAIDKKLAIMSFAYSEKQQRIGAVIKNMGVAFWDFSDNFRTEKIIEKSQGSKIFYFELRDEWVSADNDTIYCWDLKQEEVKYTITENSKAINGVCEVTHIRSIAVSYTMIDDSKQIILYQAVPKRQRLRHSEYQCQLGFEPQDLQQDSESSCCEQKLRRNVQFRRLTRIDLSKSGGCHTIHYNKFMQILIPLGFSNDVPLYLIDNQSLGVSNVTSLKGHKTIVTAIAQIDESDILITGDDKGNVIVWTLSDMRCQQTIKLASWIGSLSCVGNQLYFGDARLNVIQIEGLQSRLTDNETQRESPGSIFSHHRPQKDQFYIFTKRSCRVLNMLNGKVIRVFELCSEDEEILTVKQYLNGFVIGTSKGNILSYSMDFHLRWKLHSAHQAEVTGLHPDPENKFLLSNGRDGSVYVWSERTLQEEGPKKSLINQEPERQEEIVSVELSEKYGFFVTCDYSQNIRVWDYESCRLSHIVELSKNCYPALLKVSRQSPLMVVACSSGTIVFYRFSRKEMSFSFQLIGIANAMSFMKTEQRLTPKVDAYSIERQRFSCWTQSPTQAPHLSELLTKCSDPSCQIEQLCLDTSSGEKQLIVSYNKGAVSIVGIESIFDLHFSNSIQAPDYKKRNNIQRHIKQSVLKQISKTGVQKSCFSTVGREVVVLTNQDVIWNKKIHKDSISHLSVFEGKYLSTLCSDNYYKLSELDTGTQICSLNLNYPLPIRWEYLPNKNQEFTQKIKEALVTIDSICCDEAQISKEQFEQIDVGPFLDMICDLKEPIELQSKKIRLEELKKKSGFTLGALKPKSKKRLEDKENRPSKIQVLADEFSPSDIYKVPQPCPSLKSYEVYKRVKRYINVRESEVSNRESEFDRKKSQVEERQAIVELLSPNYLPKLLNKQPNPVCVLSQNYESKAPVSLTKQDFSKVMFETMDKFRSKNKMSNHEDGGRLSIPRQQQTSSKGLDRFLMKKRMESEHLKFKSINREKMTPLKIKLPL